MKTWAPNGEPFFWLPKAAMRTIEQGLERGAAASAKLTYCALARIAADTQSAVFQKPIAYIAALASLDRRTVERRLSDLQRLDLVAVQRRKLEGSNGNDLNQYTLATLCRKDATQCRNLPAAMNHSAVAVTGEEEKEKKEAIRKPSGTAERISLENRIKILRAREKDLAGDTAEQWQRDAAPEKVEQLRQLRAEIKALEDSLL